MERVCEQVETAIFSRGDYEMEPEVDRIIDKPRDVSGKWRTCCVVSIAFVAMVVGFIGGVALYQRYTDMPGSGHVSRQTRIIDINRDGLDVRINPEGSVCDGASCISCKADVSTQHNLGQQKDCDTKHAVTNATCYLCGDECKTFDDIRKVFHENRHGRLSCRGRRRPAHIDCCILSQMGNLNNYCGIGGHYGCDAGNKPTCKCPDGRKGDRCQEINMETVMCRCFNSPYKFCGQEGMSECNSHHKSVLWSRCHMHIDRRGELHNCICDNKLDARDASIVNAPSCFLPLTDTQTHGSSEINLGLSVDKT